MINWECLQSNIDSFHSSTDSVIVDVNINFMFCHLHHLTLCAFNIYILWSLALAGGSKSSILQTVLLYYIMAVEYQWHQHWLTQAVCVRSHPWKTSVLACHPNWSCWGHRHQLTQYGPCVWSLLEVQSYFYLSVVAAASAGAFVWHNNWTTPSLHSSLTTLPSCHALYCHAL